MNGMFENLVITEGVEVHLPNDRLMLILRMISKLRSELDQVEQLLKDFANPGNQLCRKTLDTPPTKKNKGGRISDLDYDQAFDQIYIAGEAFQEVFRKWKVSHPDKVLQQIDPYECFCQAMKRRLRKSDKSLVSSVSSPYAEK